MKLTTNILPILAIHLDTITIHGYTNSYRNILRVYKILINIWRVEIY